MPEGVPAIPFMLLAIGILGGAGFVVLSRNVVHAAFWLLEVMLCVAGMFVLLSAGFVALVQVMVYAGAVSVLLLFTVMLTLRRREDAVRPLDLSWSAGAVSVAVLALAAVVIATLKMPLATAAGRAPGIARFGMELFSSWVLPFEIASLILTVALVGAVWWSGGGRR